MNMTDPIADMLTRIRNAAMARHDYVLIPASQLKIAIAKILKEEGFIRDYEVLKDTPQRTIRVWLSYTGKKEPVVTGLKRISKPGLRVYAKSREMPRVRGGLGIAIVSTPRGIMSAKQARRLNVGGEILCYVW
ncbi:MAG: 30S ribosomal protein S8 [Acetobacteraceae bacterium]|nr:30S ribosomal protein S8 [Acetobacteraceae bacterium]